LIFLAVEIIQANPQMFAEGLNVAPTMPGCHLRRMSEVSIQSTISGVIDSLPLQTINACKYPKHNRMICLETVLFVLKKEKNSMQRSPS
jgi:hypothetical protein